MDAAVATAAAATAAAAEETAKAEAEHWLDVDILVTAARDESRGQASAWREAAVATHAVYLATYEVEAAHFFIKTGATKTKTGYIFKSMDRLRRAEADIEPKSAAAATARLDVVTFLETAKRATDSAAEAIAAALKAVDAFPGKRAAGEADAEEGGEEGDERPAKKARADEP